MTKLFFAGTGTRRKILENKLQLKYVLESFYTIEPWQIEYIKKCDMFLLDSGTFTFISKSGGGQIDFNAYLDKYIKFINDYDIKYFFELDIDLIVGYEKVKEMRKKLEQQTGKKSIPVWHRSRGIQEFKNLCKEYDYIAIGGFASKHIKRTEYPQIKQLVKYANSQGVKVHGLGFTQSDVENYGFFSVDSSSWLSGGRYGRIQYFDGNKMQLIPKPQGKKTVYYLTVDEFSLKEWIKYQKYLESK